MERRLGRGLGSLLGAASPPSPAADQNSQAEADPRQLDVRSLEPNPFQPRQVFNEEHLEELEQSIARHGILQPICVRRVGPDAYQIISGERRWRAAQRAGLNMIPVTLREADDRAMLELALVENVQRRDLDAIEKARAFREMMGRLELTQDGVAEKVGLKRSTVANHLRLLDLPSQVQEGVAEGLIAMGHARALLGLDRPKAILAAFERVVRDDLSVRATETLVRSKGAQTPDGPATHTGKASAEPKQAPWARSLEQRLEDALGTRAEVRDSLDGEYRGKIVLHYHDRESLEALMESIAPKDEI